MLRLSEGEYIKINAIDCQPWRSFNVNCSPSLRMNSDGSVVAFFEDYFSCIFLFKQKDGVWGDESIQTGEKLRAVDISGRGDRIIVGSLDPSIGGKVELWKKSENDDWGRTFSSIPNSYIIDVSISIDGS